MYRTAVLLCFTTALFLPACDDGAADQAELPAGQAPTNTPEEQNRPNKPYPIPGEENAGEQNVDPEQSDADPENESQGEAAEFSEDGSAAAGAERMQGPGLSFVLPEGWSIGQPNQFRLMTLVAPAKYNNLELSISKGRGDYGGFHGNVTRWARQAGLSTADAAKIDAFDSVNVAGIDAIWLPLINETDDRAILTVWAPRGEDPANPIETWVFKFPAAPGPVAPVQAAADDVKAIVESVEFE